MMRAAGPCFQNIYLYILYLVYNSLSFIYIRYGLKIPLLSRALPFLYEEPHKPRAERTRDLIYMHERVFGTQHIAYFVNTASLRVAKSPRRLLAMAEEASILLDDRSGASISIRDPS